MSSTLPYQPAAVPMTIYLAAAWYNDPASIYYASGILLIVLGSLLLIPSAIGVAQYTQRSNKKDTSQHSMCSTQIAFVVIASICIVAGLVAAFVVAPGQKGGDIFR